MIDPQYLPVPFVQLLNRLYNKPMSDVVIKGVPKSGKTDFALFIAECLYSLGIVKQFASNAEVKDCPWIKYIDNLQGVRTWGFSNRYSKLYIYDEVIESATNRRAMSDINVGWVQELPQISKMHLHILAIVQEEEGGKKYYESVFMDPVYLRGVWYKEQRDKAIFRSRYYRVEGYRLRKIPPTCVIFDKDTPAHFNLTQSAGLTDIKLLPRTMQVALLYSQDGTGYTEIKEQTGLKDNKQVQREVKKALKLLLQTETGRTLLKERVNGSEKEEVSA